MDAAPDIFFIEQIGYHKLADGMYDAWSCWLRGDKRALELSNVGRGKHEIYPSGMAKILFVDTVTRAGVEYLLVGGIDERESYRLYRYYDINADHGPDASTETLLLGSEAPSYVTLVAFHDAHAYLYDARTEDVLKAVDTDGDGWPDRILERPFAASSRLGRFHNAERLWPQEDGSLRLYRYVGGHGQTTGWPHQHLVDDDGDGVADRRTHVEYRWPHPSIYGRPYDGQTTLRIAGEAGRTVQAWTIEGSRAATLLGETRLASEGWQPVHIGTALAAGQLLGLCYADTQETRRVLSIRKSWPQVIRTAPRFVPRAGGRIRLEGLCFSPEMVAYLKKDNWRFDLEVEWATAELVHVAVPKLPEVVRQVWLRVELERHGETGGDIRTLDIELD